MYDSEFDTKVHIQKVREFLYVICDALVKRGMEHDQSKLESPEKELFDKYTPLLQSLEYGSPEYQLSLEHLAPALRHHYDNNSHHPEYYSDGVNGMNLIDIIEMFCDWKAATMRNKGGDLMKSIDVNKVRFNISKQLVTIFENTVNDLKW